MALFNFNSSFNQYRKALDLTESERKFLLEAKKIIRSTVRSAFNENADSYFTEDSIALLSKFQNIDTNGVKPLFMSQGSFVYKTINRPLYPPKQQMDLDYGIYLPLSYVENELSEDFGKAAILLRNVIAKCLEDICDQNNWQLKKQPKCLRITISRDSHIDLPIYSIPDDQSETIRESVESAMHQHEVGTIGRLEASILAFNKATNILLATDGGWLKSDPREIQEWVQKAKLTHGPKFIRYTRYLKGWRDKQWPNDESSFSSIMIMAALDQAFTEMSYSASKNVAEDLTSVVKIIRTFLSSNGIKHPTNDQRMDENIDNRNSLLATLDRLSINLSEAVKTNNCGLIVDCFGNRFPNDSGSQEPSPESLSTMSTPALVIAPTLKPAKS